MSYETIGNTIATMLAEITQIKIVYNYPAITFADFPAARVRMKGHNNAFITTAANTRAYVFEIDILYKSQVPADAESILRKVADLVITKIESDVSLRGSCQIARPSRGDVQFTETPIPMQYITITVEASKYVNR